MILLHSILYNAFNYFNSFWNSNKVVTAVPASFPQPNEYYIYYDLLFWRASTVTAKQLQSQKKFWDTSLAVIDLGNLISYPLYYMTP